MGGNILLVSTDSLQHHH